MHGGAAAAGGSLVRRRPPDGRLFVDVLIDYYIYTVCIFRIRLSH
jgi:hypothetical protein